MAASDEALLKVYVSFIMAKQAPVKLERVNKVKDMIRTW